MDDKYDDLVQSMLTDGKGRTLYVKADSVELRVHIVGLLLPLFEGAPTESLVDSAKQIEEYVKYG
jgi:hypothetical protein